VENPSPELDFNQVKKNPKRLKAPHIEEYKRFKLAAEAGPTSPWRLKSQRQERQACLRRLKLKYGR